MDRRSTEPEASRAEELLHSIPNRLHIDIVIALADDEYGSNLVFSGPGTQLSLSTASTYAAISWYEPGPSSSSCNRVTQNWPMPRTWPSRSYTVTIPLSDL